MRGTRLTPTFPRRGGGNRQRQPHKAALKGMITRLWSSLGVPRAVIDAHQRRKAEEPAHAWLVGCADPTGAQGGVPLMR